MRENENRPPRASSARTKRGRWSAIDSAVVLLIAAAVTVQVWQAILVRREQQAQKTPTMYDVIFTVTDARAEVLDGLNALDVLYLCEDGTPIGRIDEYVDEDGSRRIALIRDDVAADETEAETEPAQEENGGLMAQDTETETVSPFGPYDGTRFTAMGCMICTDGERYEGGLLFPDNGFILTPGSEITVRTDKVMLTIRIQSILNHTS